MCEAAIKGVCLGSVKMRFTGKTVKMVMYNGISILVTSVIKYVHSLIKPYHLDGETSAWINILRMSDFQSSTDITAQHQPLPVTTCGK